MSGGQRRQRRGFQRAGDLRVDQLGLAARQARDLMLARAWLDVAGEAIARHAPVRRVARGVLELGVADPEWETTLIELAPRLVARLAARHPQLAVRMFRLRRPGDAGAERPRALAPSTDEQPHESSATRAGGIVAPDEAPPEPASARRLERAMERYLARGSAHRAQKP